MKHKNINTSVILPAFIWKLQTERGRVRTFWLSIGMNIHQLFENPFGHAKQSALNNGENLNVEV